MVEPKHAAIVLVAIALCLNVGYAIFEGGFTGQLLENAKENIPGTSTPHVLTRIRPREGASGVLTRNLTLLVGSPSDDMTGIIQIWGTTKVSLEGSSISRFEEGSFEMVHEINGTVDVSLSGTLARTIALPFPSEDGGAKASISTSVMAYPAFGPSLSSVSDTSIRPSEVLSTVLPWSFLMNGVGELRDGDSWTMQKDAVLEGLSLPMEGTTLSYTVMITEPSEGRRKAVITAECSPFPGFDIHYTLVFDDERAWPIDMDARAEGLYMSDDGPVAIDLRYRESLTSWTEGGGKVLNWPVSYDEVVTPGVEVDPIGAVPMAGSGSLSFAALPSQCLEHAREASPVLDSFMDGQGPVSPLKLSYYRNDSRPADRSWIWNITLSSSPDAPLISAMGLKVSCISGDWLGRDQLELLEVRTQKPTLIPSKGRSLLTLSSHESIIKASSLSDSFFSVDGYSQSYRLDIVHRGGLGPDPMNALLQNMLGIRRSDAMDLFISTSSDRLEPKTLCIAVVDGSSGSLISTTRAGGSFTVLLSSYGFELA